MKKEKVETPKVDGWNTVSGFIGNCKLCGVRLGTKDPVYWRWKDGKEIISCRGCCDK